MKKTLLAAVIALLFTTSFAYGQAATGTTTVSVTVVAEAALTVTTGTTTLTNTGLFTNYTGTTNLTYYIRTTQTTGGGTLQLEVTTDFGGAGCSGGPCVGTPPTAGDALGYTCTVAAPGNGGTVNACSGTVNASTTAQTNVGTFLAGSSSLKAGNTASVAWALTDDPKYKTGTYTATVTFTISAT